MIPRTRAARMIAPLPPTGRARQTGFAAPSPANLPLAQICGTPGRALWSFGRETGKRGTRHATRQRQTHPMARHLITSAIPYINGIKHLGNLVGSQLPADLFARYCRARGDEVLFLCATDEHGTPAELAATKAGQPVADYCAEMWQVQKRLSDGFRLSFDHFGRSSSPQNHRLTQHFAKRLHEQGLIREVSETQMYSPTDGRYLPDRYIEGTCPNCGFESARGDQCDNCTKQLDPVDLIDPRSVVSGATDLEMRETRHLYLRQSAMKDELEKWIDTRDGWPVLTTSIAKKWLNDGDGLQDRGITRDLDWGIPVKRGDEDWPGMEGKVFYVWFDAPIEYIACAAEWAEAHSLDDAAWERWWRTEKGADDVRYTQFMGKDNVPFHTLSFPATMMGSFPPVRGAVFSWIKRSTSYPPTTGAGGCSAMRPKARMPNLRGTTSSNR